MASLCRALDPATRLDADIKGRAETLLAALRSPESVDGDLAERARRYIEAHVPAALTLATIATAVRSSQKRVRRVFQKRSQVSVMAFYRQRCAEVALEGDPECRWAQERGGRRRLLRTDASTTRALADGGHPRQARLGNVGPLSRSGRGLSGEGEPFPSNPFPLA
ncbi:MAG: helix-turn-helix transcriptional regulator [Acidobacteria bacterium]|nr:helix-turn-helix transcriptional regulator [Acidobacteriota bacterium]